MRVDIAIVKPQNIVFFSPVSHGVIVLASRFGEKAR